MEEETVSGLWMNLRGKKNEKKINGFQVNIVSEWTVCDICLCVCVCVCVDITVSVTVCVCVCVCVCVITVKLRVQVYV